jgi:hypothetical protein
MLGRLPKASLWLAGIHLVIVGGLVTWMLVYGATLGAEREGAVPLPMLIGQVLIVVADFPAMWVTMALSKRTAFPPVVAMPLLVILGTVQWLVIGIAIDQILRRVRSHASRGATDR